MLTTRWDKDKDNKLLQSNLYLLRLKQVGVTKLTPWLQPMIDYVDTKERQGIFFERPVRKQYYYWTNTFGRCVIFLQTEKIHLPHPAELVMMSHEAGWARLYCLVCKNIYSLRGDQLTGTGNLERFLVKVKRLLNQYKLWQSIKELVQTKTLPGLCWPEYKM